MLNPAKVAISGEELLQQALESIRKDVENGSRRNALKRILRLRAYPKGVIKEVISSIFDDDGDGVIEMANFRS
ncbi:MAG: hypothetical protein AAB416_00700 [Patescibacteria group bacterium]